MILSFLLLPWTGNASILKSIWNLVYLHSWKKHSEAIVCFVQRCSRCWCWLCETFEVLTGFRANTFQHVTKNLV